MLAGLVAGEVARHGIGGTGRAALRTIFVAMLLLPVPAVLVIAHAAALLLVAVVAVVVGRLAVRGRR